MRLYLVTPRRLELDLFKPCLEAALQGGDVAALLIDLEDETLLAGVAEALAPIAQAAGVAAVVASDSRAVGRAGADGIHISTGEADVRSALERFKPDGIVGAGSVLTRHEAMRLGELNPDYLFFGRLDKDEHDEPHTKMLDLGAWWADLFEVPAVVLCGNALEHVPAVVETGAEFLAARTCVWSYAEGPAAAVARLNTMIAEGALNAA